MNLNLCNHLLGLQAIGKTTIGIFQRVLEALLQFEHKGTIVVCDYSTLARERTCLKDIELLPCITRFKSQCGNPVIVVIEAIVDP